MTIDADTLARLAALELAEIGKRETQKQGQIAMKVGSVMSERATRAEAALARVRALADDWNAGLFSGIETGYLRFHAEPFGKLRDVRICLNAALDGQEGDDA